MKKAKIMLSAIVVLAVVGGALAFKAKMNKQVYCSDQPAPHCTFTIFDRTLSPVGVATYCTDVYNAPCDLTTTTIEP